MTRTPYIHIFILFAFIVNSFGPIPLAQADDFHLPAPGTMVRLSPAFDPPILRGIKVHPDNPFHFEFILDRGDGGLSGAALKDESDKLIKYFLASLTIPEKDLWVNLSPYEKDRIIPGSFGLTEMGRDLLAEDYILKQLTASLIYPDDEVGKVFWKRIYDEASKRYGTTNIPISTFNKVWIVPEKAVVYENASTGIAYVVDSKLKVMLEQDYLSLSKHQGSKNDTNAFSSQVIREIVIPQLTKEVNHNKNFASLRQVYNSLILAVWYKKKIMDSVLSSVYADKSKIKGINIDDPNEKEKIYQRYLRAFKKGVYNYIKEETDPMTQETLPRKYFSGGVNYAMIGENAAKMLNIVKQVPAKAMLSDNRAMLIDSNITAANQNRVFSGNSSMKALFEPIKNKPENYQVFYWPEKNRLMDIVYKMNRRHIEDVDGHTLQTDFCEPMVDDLIYQSYKQGIRLVSLPLFAKLVRVYNSFQSEASAYTVRRQGMIFGNFDKVINRILKVQNMHEADALLNEARPKALNDQPLTEEFKRWAATVPKDLLTVIDADHSGKKITVFDLGSPAIRQMIKDKGIPIVVPDEKILTRYTDKDLLETAQLWDEMIIKKYWIAVDRKGRMFFVKTYPPTASDRAKGASFTSRINDEFFLDYRDMGILKVPAKYQHQVIQELQERYKGMNGHPDQRPSNLLVKVTVKDEWTVDIATKIIDWDRNPKQFAMMTNPVSLIKLLREAQLLLAQGFMVKSPGTGEMQKRFASYSPDEIKAGLEEILEKSSYKEQLKAENILTIVSHSRGLYTIEINEAVIDRLLEISPSIIDRWAWEKAGEIVGEGQFGLRETESLSELNEGFKKAGVASLAERKRVEKYIGVVESAHPYIGHYNFFRKGLGAVILEAQIKEPRFLSGADYGKLPPEQKEILEGDFVNTFSPPWVGDKERYVLSYDHQMEQLMQGAKELSDMVGPHDRAICLGRSPFYIFYTAMALEGRNSSIFNNESERYVQVSFSGRWDKSDSHKPKPNQVLAFRKYLSDLHLTPQEIIERLKNKHGKTIIVDYLNTSGGVKSFLGLLIDWAKELEDAQDPVVSVSALKEAMVVESLRRSEEGYILPSNLLGVKLRSFPKFDYHLGWFFSNGNDDRDFNDGIKDQYPPENWDDPSIDPKSDAITVNGYLISSHILNWLQRKGELKNNSSKAMITPLSLYREAKRIVKEGFINKYHPDLREDSLADKNQVMAILEKRLDMSPYGKELRQENVLKVQPHYYRKSEYWITIDPDFFQKVLNAPNTVLDRWAWDKAHEVLQMERKLTNSVVYQTDSFDELNKSFNALKITPEQRKRIEGYLEVAEAGYPYYGAYRFQVKEFSGVARNVRIVDPKWLSVDQYSGIAADVKRNLEEDFQYAFGNKVNEKPYVLSSDLRMQQLEQGAIELGKIMKSHTRAVCFGRSPFYLFYTWMAMEGLSGSIFNGKSDKYVQVSFTGSFVDKDSEKPTQKQVDAFREYLTKIHLTPREIITRNKISDIEGKTVLFDYIETGDGLKSFLSILMDWAKEEEDNKDPLVSVAALQKALEIYSLRDSYEDHPLAKEILGVNVKSLKNFDYHLGWFLSNGNADPQFRDGIKDAYTTESWDDSSIDPTSDKITTNGYLISSHILNWLEKKGLLKSGNTSAMLASTERQTQSHEEIVNVMGMFINGLGGKNIAKGILSELRKAQLAEKFMVLMKDPNMLRHYRKFIDFYESRKSELDLMSPEELRQAFIEHLGFETVYRADLYNPQLLKDVQQAGVQSRILKNNGTLEKEVEITSKIGLPAAVKASIHRTTINSNSGKIIFDGRKENLWLSVSVVDPKIKDQGIAQKRAEAVARQVASNYARAILIGKNSKIIAPLKGAGLKEGILALYKREQIMVIKARVPKFYLIRQTGIGEAMEADGILKETSTRREAKYIALQLKKGEVSQSIDQNNDPAFEGLIDYIPPSELEAIMLYPLGEGIGYKAADINGESFSNNAEELVVGIDHRGEIIKEMDWNTGGTSVSPQANAGRFNDLDRWAAYRDFHPKAGLGYGFITDDQVDIGAFLSAYNQLTPSERLAWLNGIIRDIDNYFGAKKVTEERFNKPFKGLLSFRDCIEALKASPESLINFFSWGQNKFNREMIIPQGSSLQSWLEGNVPAEFRDLVSAEQTNWWDSDYSRKGIIKIKLLLAQSAPRIAAEIAADKTSLPHQYYKTRDGKEIPMYGDPRDDWNEGQAGYQHDYIDQEMKSLRDKLIWMGYSLNLTNNVLKLIGIEHKFMLSGNWEYYLKDTNEKAMKTSQLGQDNQEYVYLKRKISIPEGYRNIAVVMTSRGQAFGVAGAIVNLANEMKRYFRGEGLRIRVLVPAMMKETAIEKRFIGKEADDYENLVKMLPKGVEIETYGDLANSPAADVAVYYGYADIGESYIENARLKSKTAIHVPLLGYGYNKDFGNYTHVKATDGTQHHILSQGQNTLGNMNLVLNTDLTERSLAIDKMKTKEIIALRQNVMQQIQKITGESDLFNSEFTKLPWAFAYTQSPEALERYQNNLERNAIKRRQKTVLFLIKGSEFQKEESRVGSFEEIITVNLSPSFSNKELLNDILLLTGVIKGEDGIRAGIPNLVTGSQSLLEALAARKIFVHDGYNVNPNEGYDIVDRILEHATPQFYSKYKDSYQYLAFDRFSSDPLFYDDGEEILVEYQHQLDPFLAQNNIIDSLGSQIQKDAHGDEKIVTVKDLSKMQDPRHRAVKDFLDRFFAGKTSYGKIPYTNKDPQQLRTNEGVREVTMRFASYISGYYTRFYHGDSTDHEVVLDNMFKDLKNERELLDAFGLKLTDANDLPLLRDHVMPVILEYLDIVPRPDIGDGEWIDVRYKGKPIAIEKAKKVNQTGGIDLTKTNIKLQTQNKDDEIKFHMDPAMLHQFQNASGFVPVIINIKPLKNLSTYLGLNQKSADTLSVKY